MAIKNFIPTVWSETLVKELNNRYIGVDHCIRDYEGDISECGSVVKILGVNDISLYDYIKDRNAENLDEIDLNERTLEINKAKYFNFMIDDIDRAQSVPGIMEEAMRKAAAALANDADKTVFSTIATHNGSELALSTAYGISNVNKSIDVIFEAREALYKNGVGSDEEVFLEIAPEVATAITKANIALSTSNAESIKNGYLGSLAGCKIYITNNLHPLKEDNFDARVCVMRTKRAVAFAEQLSEIEAYRPEKKFADAVKGLHLYGSKVIYPKEIAKLEFVFDKIKD